LQLIFNAHSIIVIVPVPHLVGVIRKAVYAAHSTSGPCGRLVEYDYTVFLQAGMSARDIEDLLLRIRVNALGFPFSPNKEFFLVNRILD
jgi:hypothetical protein